MTRSRELQSMRVPPVSLSFQSEGGNEELCRRAARLDEASCMATGRQASYWASAAFQRIADAGTQFDRLDHLHVRGLGQQPPLQLPGQDDRSGESIAISVALTHSLGSAD